MRGGDGKGMNFEELDEARKTLGLGVKASMREVKNAFRKLSKKHHPDMGGQMKDFKGVCRAYETMMEYIKGYEYSFKIEDVQAQYPEIALEKCFGHDWVGGRGRE